jgi:AHBA synthesis associated protein
MKAPGGVVGVLFDWDGVLLDSLGASFSVYNKIFARIGTRQLTQDEYLALQSPNWYDFYSKMGLPPAVWKEVDDEWMRLYREESPKLQPDASRCLSALKGAGCRLALVSNGSKARVEREVGDCGLGGFFESVVCGETKEELKPSPVMLQKTLALLGLRPSEAVYVGDSPADVQAARNAGIPSIGVVRGPIQGERLRLEKPDHTFDGLDAMSDFLLNVS